MTVRVDVLRDDLVDVTVEPSWLARLFGARAEIRRAARTAKQWRWASSAELVPEHIAWDIWIAIERWETRRYEAWARRSRLSQQ